MFSKTGTNNLTDKAIINFTKQVVTLSISDNEELQKYKEEHKTPFKMFVDRG